MSEEKKKAGKRNVLASDAPSRCEGCGTALARLARASTPAFRAGWDAVFGKAKPEDLN
jgi:hypothetical protein